jgi:hypothetical protein
MEIFMTDYYEPPNIPLSKEDIDYRADASVAKRASSMSTQASDKVIDCYRNTNSLKILFGACSAEEKVADDAFKKADDATKKAEKSWQKLQQVPPWF